MKIDDFYSKFTSDCVAGSASQILTRKSTSVTVTGRCTYLLRNGGACYALLFSNAADGTFSDGVISKANDPGGEWDIISMRAGLLRGVASEPKEWIELSFDSKTEKHVGSAEVFCTDPFPLNADAGDVLLYEITLKGACFPYHEEIILPTVMLGEDGHWRPGKEFPVPIMIGCDRPVSVRVGFLGDSITQGIGTEVNSYAHYVAKIAEGLPENISVWDLGVGYARAMDAAKCGQWLKRASQCDTVNICLGVNDLGRGRDSSQILDDLSAAVRYLKGTGCRVILFTVPPFGHGEPARTYWREINRGIRTEIGKQADAVFDVARVLSMPEPEEYMPAYGPHPNAIGCAAVAKAYLESGLAEALQKYRRR